MDWIIVGLGNPGKKYELTRHNAGFLALDMLAERLSIKMKKLKFQALCGDNGKLLLIKPQTFMNASGQSVRQAAEFYKLPPERVVVVYDEVALPFGRLRVRAGGSDGGHNGIKDILYQLHSDRFPRVRIGVGAKPHPEMELADWVLSDFSKAEQPLIQDACARAAEAAELLVREGAEAAMARFNAPPPSGL